MLCPSLTILVTAFLYYISINPRSWKWDSTNPSWDDWNVISTNELPLICNHASCPCIPKKDAWKCPQTLARSFLWFRGGNYSVNALLWNKKINADYVVNGSLEIILKIDRWPNSTQIGSLKVYLEDSLLFKISDLDNYTKPTSIIYDFTNIHVRNFDINFWYVSPGETANQSNHMYISYLKILLGTFT